MPIGCESPDHIALVVCYACTDLYNITETTIIIGRPRVILKAILFCAVDPEVI